MTTVRTTQQTMGAQTFANLQTSLDKLQGLQERLSSGKRVERPSDDPTSVDAALRYRSTLSRSAQHQRSIDDAQGWLGSADSALSSANTLLQQAHDLVLQGMNGATDQTSRNALAAQVDELAKSMQSIANTNYQGRPIFGGTAAGDVAYSATGQYVGDGSSVTRMVDDQTVVTVGIPGPQAFGTPPNDVFSTLAKVSTDLRNSPQNLGADLTAVEGSNQKVLDALGFVGARSKTLEGIKNRATASDTNVQGLLSTAEDIDLPKAIMDLNLQNSAYQAALAATQKVIQPSLVDFLK